MSSRMLATAMSAAALLLACTAGDRMTDPKPKHVIDLDEATRRAQQGLPPQSATVEFRPTAGLPADASDEMKRWHASVGRGRPAVLLSSDNLADGAVAKVIRDPEADEPRLLVFASQSLDDEVIALAGYVLRRSEMNAFELTTRREITLWRDRRYRVEEDATIREGTIDFTWLAGGTSEDADAIRALAARAGRKTTIGRLRGTLIARDAR